MDDRNTCALLAEENFWIKMQWNDWFVVRRASQRSQEWNQHRYHRFHFVQWFYCTRYSYEWHVAMRDATMHRKMVEQLCTDQGRSDHFNHLYWFLWSNSVTQLWTEKKDVLSGSFVQGDCYFWQWIIEYRRKSISKSVNFLSIPSSVFMNILRD